jgi:hypothetical protein
MFGYPFKTIYLKSDQNRNSLHKALLEKTFLSDFNYKNTEKIEKTFYGEVSNQDFKLETISRKQKIANFAHGEIKGVENDMYIVLRIGALEHIRIYALFLATFAICTFFILEGLFVNYKDTYGPEYFDNQLNIVLCILELIFLVMICVKSISFKQSIQPTINFFETFLKAKKIEKHEMPDIFNF